MRMLTASGKSSIVCAIAVGLGMKLSQLGRSEDLGEFVMQGKQEGYVEVELFKLSGKEENTVIRRTLKVDSPARFAVDGKPSTLKEVVGMVEKAQIQLSNLCTFLPQVWFQFGVFFHTQAVLNRKKLGSSQGSTHSNC